MPEVNLDLIKDAVAAMEDDSITDSVWTQRAVRLAAQVPRMIAEIERLQHLTGDGPFPSCEAYESMAVAMQGYRSVAEEMLKHFDRGSRGVDLVVSSPVPIETVSRWRSVLGGGS